MYPGFYIPDAAGPLIVHARNDVAPAAFRDAVMFLRCAVHVPVINGPAAIGIQRIDEVSNRAKRPGVKENCQAYSASG